MHGLNEELGSIDGREARQNVPYVGMSVRM